MTKERRYDLDWLRVIVFGLLIFYHVGMLFVPWGFHIKNNETSDWFLLPMLFLNQWRLPLLFLISGMGTRFALSYRSQSQFLKERTKRLLLPLIVGMIVIIAPQVYVERLVNSEFSGSYFQFWPKEYFQGIYPEGNLSWHHLWFLPYLLVFSVVSAPLFIYLRDHPNAALLRGLRAQLRRPFGLFIFVIPLYFVEAFIEPFFPVTHALIGDWFALVYYYLFYLFGFEMISEQDDLWPALERHRINAVWIGIICFVGMVIMWQLPDTTLRHFTEAFLKITNVWAWIFVLLAFAAKYLNRPGPVLHYCNTAVYPFYIFHQTVMMIAAYFMIHADLHILLKFLLLSVITFLGSWILYELVRRSRFLRPLFGLKNA
ncbi:MAG: acyltransferase family protein [Bacteroidota bacterium]